MVEKPTEDAEELVSNLNNSEVVIGCDLQGKCGFHIGGINMDGVSVLILSNPQKKMRLIKRKGLDAVLRFSLSKDLRGKKICFHVVI